MLFVSYWREAEDIVRWKKVSEHLEAQRLGKSRWYGDYRIRIAKVERDYGKNG
jgi:heme-degrading monooxygenase HmoA